MTTMAGFRASENPDPGNPDKDGFVHGPKIEGGEPITRIDFSYWPFGQRISLNKVIGVIGVAGVLSVGATIIPFPGL